jgi:phage recombination protein Bet
MTTATQANNQTRTETSNDVFKELMGRSVTFKPLGETSEITLSVGIVRRFITNKTRSGKVPDEAEITKFIMLCKARELNPWVGDAYLVGFDSKDGPQFNLITAIQAFYKRAELNPNYDGMESGVSVLKEDGSIEDRQGDFLLPKEKLVGGWARVYRKDQKVPMFDRLRLETYSTGRSRWMADPAGMIVKCAESSVLRRAFPNQLSALYVAEEMQRTIADGSGTPEPKRIQTANTRTEQLADALGEPEAYHDHGSAGEESQEPPEAFGEESQDVPETDTESEPASLGNEAMGFIDRIGRAETKESLQAAFSEANQFKLANRLTAFEFAEIKKEHDALAKTFSKKK